MTTRTAAEALEEVLAHNPGYGKLPGTGKHAAHVAAYNFVHAHANTLRAALQPQSSKPAFWARLLNGELDDRSDYCVASDPNDLGDGDEEPGITIVPVYLDPPRIGAGIEPRGCPTPGACSCPAAQPQAEEVEECDNGLGHIEITDGVPDWVKGVATEARRLLRTTQSAAQKPVNAEGPLELGPQPAPGFHFDARGVLVADGESPAQSAPGREWPAKLRLTELLREAANALEACHAANEDLLSKRVSAAPTQEPVITVSGPVACGKSYIMELIYKALRDAGLHPYSDDLAHERRMVEEQPQPPAKVWKLREAVYAAPPPDEARELLVELFDEWVDDDDQSELTQRIRAYLEKHK